MSAPATMAIVGAGLAGAKAAEAARAAGYDGRVLLIGQEPRPPYDRPPLSKAVLRGEVEPSSAMLHADGWYGEHGVELVVDRAVGLDAEHRRLELATGETVTFDTAVLSTGAAPRVLRAPGGDLDGVHYLRTAEDAVRLRDAIRGAGRVAVIGAGWIGSEVAASARQMGADVVLIDPAPTPLHGVLGTRLGEQFRRLHADHGVDLRLGVGVHAVCGDKSADAVELDGGRREPADVVVVGVGVIPSTALAEGAGLRVDNGVVADQRLETSVPGIYVAGDAANPWHPHYGRHLRVEHWDTALHQGTVAGRNAAGHRDVYGRLPYFFSDQYDLGMEFVGRPEPGDEVTIRGDLDSRAFIAFWHRDGLVSAAMNVNVWDVVDDLRAIVASRSSVDPARLADTEAALDIRSLSSR